MGDIDDWLLSLDLGNLSAVFHANDVDLATLAELSDDDLQGLGLSLGQRRRILRALREAPDRETADMSPGLAQNEVLQAEAERRQLTVLFCDMVGSTEISRRLDPEEMLDLRDAYHRVCREVIDRHGGRVTQFLGDGVVAFFGYPTASEHDAVAAVRAGLALASGAGTVSDSVPVRIRVGIATGLAVLFDQHRDRPDAVGDVLNLAARLQELARPNGVVISEPTFRLVTGVIDCAALGPRPLKGFERPMQVWAARGELLAERAFAARQAGTESPLVGREGELAELRRRWEQASSGSGCVVVLSGEAGLGKSRLGGEFIREIGGAATILKFFGAADAAQTPLHPVVAQIAWTAGFATGDPPDLKLDKLERFLARIGLDTARHAPLYAALCGIPSGGRYPPLDLSPQRLRLMIRDAMIEAVAHLALRRPVLVFFEDLHWMDPTTLELVAALADALPSWPVMLLTTTRPEQAAPSDAGHVHRITLGRLDRAAAETLLRSETARLAGFDTGVDSGVDAGFDAGFDPGLAEQVLDRADGVPLYLEELIKATAVADRAHEPEIPSTLQDALMARLDRLGPAKQIAQLGAVIGRDLHPDLVASVAGVARHTVEAVLERLVAEGVLVHAETRGDTRTGDTGSGGPLTSDARTGDTPSARLYRFRHALLRDAAYASQLRRTRRSTHARVAEVLRRDFPRIVDANPAELARHLAAAGDAAAASAQWRRAGLVALAGAHYRVAIDAYRKALETAPDVAADPAFELEVLTELGTAQIALMGFAAAEVGTTYGRAEALGRRLGSSAALGRALWGQWLFHLVKGNLGHARQLAEELAGIAEALEEDGLLLEARWALGNTLFWLGRLSEAEAALSAALALHDPQAHRDHAFLYGQDPEVAALCYLGLVRWAQGDERAARACIARSIRVARALRHPFTTAWALSFAALISAWSDAPHAARTLAHAALRHTEEQIVPFWQSAMTIVHGWARLRLDDPERGLEEAQAGLAHYDMIGSETVQPYFRGLVAECLAATGRTDAAAQMLATALERAQRSGERISAMRLGVVAARLDRVYRVPMPAGVAPLAGIAPAARAAGAAAVEMEAVAEQADHLIAAGRGAEARDLLEAALAVAREPPRRGAARRARAILEALETLDERRHRDEAARGTARDTRQVHR